MTLPITCFDRRPVKGAFTLCSSKVRVEPNLFADTVADDHEK